MVNKYRLLNSLLSKKVLMAAGVLVAVLIIGVAAFIGMSGSEDPEADPLDNFTPPEPPEPDHGLEGTEITDAGALIRHHDSQVADHYESYTLQVVTTLPAENGTTDETIEREKMYRYADGNAGAQAVTTDEREVGVGGEYFDEGAGYQYHMFPQRDGSAEYQRYELNNIDPDSGSGHLQMALAGASFEFVENRTVDGRAVRVYTVSGAATGELHLTERGIISTADIEYEGASGPHRIELSITDVNATSVSPPDWYNNARAATE